MTSTYPALLVTFVVLALFPLVIRRAETRRRVLRALIALVCIPFLAVFAVVLWDCLR